MENTTFITPQTYDDMGHSLSHMTLLLILHNDCNTKYTSFTGVH